jgi:hypothetical protein
MKNFTKISAVWIIFLIMSVSSTTALNLRHWNANGKSDVSVIQEGGYIKKLQWFSPNGELPGTYEEYIKTHPLQQAEFFKPEIASIKSNNGISLLVDATLYPEISDSITQYIDDLAQEGYYVNLETVTHGTPDEIKNWVKQQYSQGSIGIVFIGDITAAWAEVSEDVFPCDLFYMDIDGNWQDADKDGDYESHTSGTGDTGPEIYVGRIYASTLNYDSEKNMINDYFSKVHNYRVGKLWQPWRGLEYVEEDWYDMDVALDNIYNDDVTRYDYGFYTTAQDYLNQMSLGQHFVQVCVHSYSGGHYFGTRPTESSVYAHVYVYSPTDRSAKLLLGSDDGIKVWLNKQEILTKEVYTEWRKDEFRVNVQLNAGWNQLLCKISQGGGDYKFSACFKDTSNQPFYDLVYQTNNPAYYEGEAEYIRSWLLNGFHQDNPDYFYNYLKTNYLGKIEANINPNEGDEMGGKTWAVYNSGNPYIDINGNYNDIDYGVCYAFTKIQADSEKTCQLWMGYDDGARVWLNGKEIIFDNRYGSFTADYKKVDITLQPGENRLLVKISEWMGDSGFTAKICTSDGKQIDGISYDPGPTPITHIGTWLINGPYANKDQNTRLTYDYLGGESNVEPSVNDPAPIGEWQRGIGNGCPFNLGTYFDHGDWVLSEDLQNNDPPVLFYNLFACGPGRYTDENYLAGAYIFHTTYGLITVASSKSGSMLNFNDFTEPLGKGSSIGEAFQKWFEKQVPFELWEQEWYYGMCIFGDPTLRILKLDNYPPYKPEITGPSKGVPGKEYTFQINNVEDLDGDAIYCYWDWGNSNNSGWKGPYISGDNIIDSHTWDSEGTYTIKAKLKDVNGAESDWATLNFSLSKKKILSNFVFQKILICYLKILS